MWKELSMLLENDVVEGREVKKLAEVNELFPMLQRHMERVREQLGKGHEGYGESPGELKVPPGFQAQLGKLWDAYLAVQKSLAGDDLKAARKAVAEVRTSLEKVDGKVLPERAREFWKREHANLNRVLDQLSKAGDLKGLRAGFSPLSDELILLVKTFGIEPAGPVYELRCSMAFDGRGASWLQKDDKPRNPYFGAEMPACADRVRPIAGPEAEEGHHE
jgi:Cu(I)/Ag(I) efflux system membrane fusion protein